MRRSPTATRSLLRSIPGVVLTTMVFVAASSGMATADPQQVPRWPANPTWQRYVEAPTTPEVEPVAILGTTGSVTGAQSLTDPGGGGSATLTRSPGGPAPSVVLDYGKDVSGIPYFAVRAESGAPVLRSAYSEGLQYLGPDGDDTPSSSPAGDPSRVDNLIVGSPGTVDTGLIQGGERYERISLASPGTVTLSAAGISFTPVRATAGAYRGWFDSSSPELDRIWYDGAYTTQLDELPADTVPAPWRISDGALETVEGGVGLLHQGLGWTDYTVSFDTRVVNDSSDWVVRAPSPSSGYLFLLHASDQPGTADTLSEVAIGPDRFSLIASVALPAPFSAGSWHHVTTVVSGSHISTSIDGRPVASFDTSSQPPGSPVYRTGTVGFEGLDSTALYRDLVVTGPAGGTLFSNNLSAPSALADFPGPDVSTTNHLPVIVDGAKRDRVVWSGDLGVEVPNVFYTTAAADYARGSLQLLASHQVADGETGTNVNPTAPLGSFPETGRTYSTSYSMDEVDNIATYYLFTGDLSFVRSEWPVITRELAYNASLVDSRGLLVTDTTDGQDWDYYDGEKTGEVTAFNDIYYRTLTDAAIMAGALGDSTRAGLYRQRAAQLRTAINRYLFDAPAGLYSVSNLKPRAFAQDANSLAVAFGVAPTDEDAAILSHLTKALPSTPDGPLAFTTNAGYSAGISPFVTNEEVQALFDSGRTAAAISLLQTVWGHMDAPGPDDTGSDWELVSPNGAPGFGKETSLAHGWASGATADLSSYVLGVQPTAAGFATWSLDPHPGDLSWVEGDVPTPTGTIAARWAQGAAGRFSLQVTAPGGTRGVITVPVPTSGAVVTVRATGPGGRSHPPVTLETPAGTSSDALAAVGGTTYDLTVLPR